MDCFFSPGGVYYINVQCTIVERYRSGHNGADSKSVCVKAHVGSNPTRSAMNTDISWYKKTHRMRWVFCYTCKYAGNRRLFELVLQEYTERLVGGFFYGNLPYP